MKDFAVYARLSFRDENEESITRQTSQGVEWVKGHKFNPVVYVEPAGHHSGRSEKKRPEWQRLKDDIIAGKVAGVWVADLARASRSIVDTLQFIDLVKKHNVVFVSQKEVVDTTTAAGMTFVAVLAAFNQYTSDELSERQRRRHAFRKSRGETSGRPPLGLRLDKETHKFAPSGETYGTEGKTYLDTVKRFCELYASGLGCQSAARQMNDEGYMMRDTRGKPRKCQNARLFDVLYIIEAFEPFIPPKLYARVIMLREQRRGNHGTSERTKHPPSLCRKVLRCSKCGRKWSNYHHFRRHPSQGHHTGYEWHAYRHQNAPDCEYSDKLIRVPAIDEQVWAWLKRLEQVSDEEIERRIDASEQLQAAPDLAIDYRQKVVALEARLKRIDSALFDEDFGAGEAARARWKALQADTEKELEEAREKLESVTPPPRARLSREELHDLHRSVLQAFQVANDPQLNNQLVRALFERIVLDVPTMRLTFHLWPELEAVYGDASMSRARL